MKFIMKIARLRFQNVEAWPFVHLLHGQNRGTIKRALLHFLLAGMGGPSSIQSYVVLKDLIAVC